MAVTWFSIGWCNEIKTKFQTKWTNWQRSTWKYSLQLQGTCITDVDFCIFLISVNKVIALPYIYLQIFRCCSYLIEYWHFVFSFSMLDFSKRIFHTCRLMEFCIFFSMLWAVKIEGFTNNNNAGHFNWIENKFHLHVHSLFFPMEKLNSGLRTMFQFI